MSDCNPNRCNMQMTKCAVTTMMES